MVGVNGVEPSVSYSPTAYKAAALTAELHPVSLYHAHLNRVNLLRSININR